MAAPHMVDLRALLPEDLIWQFRILILVSLHARILKFPEVEAEDAQHPSAEPHEILSKAQGPSHDNHPDRNDHDHPLEMNHVVIRPKVLSREAQGSLVLNNAHWDGSNSLT